MAPSDAMRATTTSMWLVRIAPDLWHSSFIPTRQGAFTSDEGSAFYGAKLYDLHGRLLRFERFEGQTETSFQLGNLLPGTYLLQAIGEDGKTGLRGFKSRVDGRERETGVKITCA